MALPRWLRPWHPASGAVFGYLFGYAVWLALLITFAVNDGSPPAMRELGYGLVWAVPWAVLWCISGALSQDRWRYPGTTVTALGIVLGTTHSLVANSFDGWQTVTIPVYSVSHCVALHVVMLPIWILVWWIRGEGEDDS